MPTFTEQYVNDELKKESWGEGPWADEPDKAVWVDEATDLDCMIVRNRMGSLCGYVGVSNDHPWFGLDYEQPNVEVHGGLTFADGCHEDGERESSICHITQPGRPDEVWWLGFDTAHAGDLSPGLYANMPEELQRSRQWEQYRDLKYIVAEVESLAAQVAAAS